MNEVLKSRLNIGAKIKREEFRLRENTTANCYNPINYIKTFIFPEWTCKHKIPD